MTLDQLRVFVGIAEHGHMTRAAKALGISQSGASAAVKSLESEFDVQLFNRVGRGIELSQAGLRFLPEAKAVLERTASARLLLQNVSHVIAGSVSLAASQTVASYWLPSRLASFHEEFPDIKLDVKAGNTRDVEGAVLQGDAEIGLVEGRVQSTALKRRKVDVDRMKLVLSSSALPLRKVRGSGVDLRSVRWIVREGGSGTREVLTDLATRHGVDFEDLQIFLVLPTNEAVCAAVEAGAGAAIISEHVVARSLADGTVVQIPLDIPARNFTMITHRDRSPTLANLALQEHLLKEQMSAQVTQQQDRSRPSPTSGLKHKNK